MLFPDIPHRNLPAVTVGDCDAENAFAQEDSLGVVPKSAVSEVCEKGL
jgi:hypothetical protein